jgi:hypothetical protein
MHYRYWSVSTEAQTYQIVVTEMYFAQQARASFRESVMRWLKTLEQRQSMDHSEIAACWREQEPGPLLAV